MLKDMLKYFRLPGDQGIIDGQVVLYANHDTYLSYKTRDIPSGPAPKVIVFKGAIYGDTGTYDAHSFRIYEDNLGVHKHKSLSDNEDFKIY